MAELKQTKSLFKVIGNVTRIDKEGAYRQDVAQKGKKEGELYRALKFGVKTSDTNEITVEMFDFEPNQVFMWNSELAKEAKANKKTYKGDRFDFEEWEERQDELREEGYAIIEPRIGLTHDDSGKIQSKGVPSFVASKEIYDNLKNGDGVIVEGEIRYSTYEGQDGKMKERKTFTIKKLFKLTEPVNFEHEKFEEVTYFEQEIVFVAADDDKATNKTYVTGRIIDYKKDFHDTNFVIDYNGEGEDGKDSSMEKLKNAFLKKMKFGDLLDVHGSALNRVILKEVAEEENDDDDLLSQLGGKAKPKHAQGYVAKEYINEMQLEGVDAWSKRLYKESDFQKDTLIDDEDDLGGKKKPTGKANPFDVVDEDNLEIDDEELPF